MCKLFLGDLNMGSLFDNDSQLYCLHFHDIFGQADGRVGLAETSSLLEIIPWLSQEQKGHLPLHPLILSTCICSILFRFINRVNLYNNRMLIKLLLLLVIFPLANRDRSTSALTTQISLTTLRTLPVYSTMDNWTQFMTTLYSTNLWSS